MTLQKLKEITEIPEHGRRAPSARNLRETGRAVAEKQLTDDTWIAVYQNGYALYHACGHSTVFPIYTCGDYLYVLGGISSFIPDQKAKEKGRTVSYSAISEEWEAMEDIRENPLEYLVDMECRNEMLQCLTERQRAAASLCFLQQKSRKEAAKELGITSPAVSAILSQAARRLRKRYPDRKQAEKAVAAV